MRLARPTPELHGRRVDAVLTAIEAHQYRSLLDATRCACGEPVAEGVPALQRHAVEQLLISLPETPVVEVPADADLITRAVEALLDHMPARHEDDDDAESPDPDEFWHMQATRMHSKVYAPLITGLVDELRAVGIGWETLVEHHADTVEDHNQERDWLRTDRDQLRLELQARNKAYGRASTTIHELRTEVSWQRDRKFEADNKRGLAVADLVATRMQVAQQTDTIRSLLNQIRELGGTVDDAELPGTADVDTSAGVSIQ